MIREDATVEEILGLAPKQGAIVGGAFEGASRLSRELGMWNSPMFSADRDILPDKVALDTRSREALRNDAYAAAGANIHRDSIVGANFLLNAKPAWKVLGLDEVWAAEFQEEAESKFTLFAESPANWVDASRHNTLTEFVRLGVGVYVMSGEVLVSSEWVRQPDRPYRTAFQMVELDRLSNPNGVMDTPNLRGGVVLDDWGAPTGYHIRMGHPSDNDTTGNAWRWQLTPARKPWGRIQVIHIYERQRAAQSRGISSMASALRELKVTRKFRDITLQNAVVNATYAASIESELPDEAVFSALGGGQRDVGEAVQAYARAYLGEIGKYTKGANNLAIDGVKIPHLFPGTKLQLRPAGTPGGIGTAFEQSLLRYIAAAIGVSYEELSRDFSQTNYVSFRAAAGITLRSMQAKKMFCADKLASLMYRNWLEEALNAQQIESMPRKAPNFYEGLNADAYTRCEWIGASRGQIDELKETQAAVLRITNNLSTIEDETARLGKDWRAILAQKAREQGKLKELDLLPPEMAPGMMNAVSGEPTDPGEDDSAPAKGSGKKGNGNG